MINVHVYRRGKTLPEVHRFRMMREAIEFCREEVEWESTARVVCDELNFDEEGWFARREDSWKSYLTELVS